MGEDITCEQMKPEDSSPQAVKKSYVSDSSAEGQQQKKTTATSDKGTGKKRGTYNNYKDEAGQQKVKHAIETFLERRRMNSMASLRAFAAEVDIKYETLKPYCREDESKRKTFVIKGQTKLVPEVRFFDIIYMKPYIPIHSHHLIS